VKNGRGKVSDEHLQKIERAIRRNEQTLSQLKMLLDDMKSAQRRTAEQMTHYAQTEGAGLWSGDESYGMSGKGAGGASGREA
jgi:hypothetical protein